MIVCVCDICVWVDYDVLWEYSLLMPGQDAKLCLMGFLIMNFGLV